MQRIKNSSLQKEREGVDETDLACAKKVDDLLDEIAHAALNKNEIHSEEERKMGGNGWMGKGEEEAHKSKGSIRSSDHGGTDL